MISCYNFKKLQDVSLTEKVKRILTGLINNASKFPVSLKLEGELYVAEPDRNEMLGYVVRWLDNKGYDLNCQEETCLSYPALIVSPK